jgi:hypothetical protein
MKWNGSLTLLVLIAVGCGSEKGNGGAWRPSAVLPEGAAATPAKVPQGTVAAPSAVEATSPLEKPFNFKTLTPEHRQYLHATAAKKFRATVPWVTDEEIAKMNALADQAWDMEERLGEQFASGAITKEQWHRQRMEAYAGLHARESNLDIDRRAAGGSSDARAQ